MTINFNPDNVEFIFAGFKCEGSREPLDAHETFTVVLPCSMDPIPDALFDWPPDEPRTFVTLTLKDGVDRLDVQGVDFELKSNDGLGFKSDCAFTHEVHFCAPASDPGAHRYLIVAY